MENIEWFLKRQAERYAITKADSEDLKTIMGWYGRHRVGGNARKGESPRTTCGRGHGGRSVRPAASGSRWWRR
jgi:hypothetical protein